MANARRNFRRRRVGRNRRRSNFRRSRRTVFTRRYIPKAARRLKRIRQPKRRYGPEWKSYTTGYYSGVRELRVFPEVSIADGNVADQPNLQFAVFACYTPDMNTGSSFNTVVGRRLNETVWKLRYNLYAAHILFSSLLTNAPTQYTAFTASNVAIAVRMVVYQVRNADGRYSQSNSNYHRYAVQSGLLSDSEALRIHNELFFMRGNTSSAPTYAEAEQRAINLHRFRMGTNDDIRILHDRSRVIYSLEKSLTTRRMRFRLEPLKREQRNESTGDTESYFDNHAYALWFVQILTGSGVQSTGSGSQAASRDFIRIGWNASSSLVYRDD